MEGCMTKVARVPTFALACVIGLVAVVGLSAQAQDAQGVAVVEDVLARVRDQIGASPMECGRHPFPITDEAAVTKSAQCVLDAAKERRQSWMIAYGSAADSWVATGALSGSDGVVRRFRYDSSLGSQGRGKPTMDLTACPAPEAIRKNRRIVVVECSIR
jgi:hypothetical protein